MANPRGSRCIENDVRDARDGVADSDFLFTLQEILRAAAHSWKRTASFSEGRTIDSRQTKSLAYHRLRIRIRINRSTIEIFGIGDSVRENERERSDDIDESFASLAVKRHQEGRVVAGQLPSSLRGCSYVVNTSWRSCNSRDRPARTQRLSS